MKMSFICKCLYDIALRGENDAADYLWEKHKAKCSNDRL